MKILITGGAGFIGSHLVDGFLRAGHEVQVIDNLSSGKRDNLPADVELYETSLSDEDDCAEIFGSFRPDVLCHHAAQISVRDSVRDPITDAHTNILGTLSLLECCRTYKTKLVIFASSGGVIYGETDHLPTPETLTTYPESPYGIAKLSVEHYLRFYQLTHGIRSVSLRYANVYGPRQTADGEAGVIAIFVNQLRNKIQPVINGDGEQTRDFVHVEDVVSANLAVLEGDLVGVYNVGMGVETSINEVYQLVAGAHNSTDQATHGPAKDGEQLRSCLDASKLHAATGWRARVGLADGIESYVKGLT